MMILNLAGTAQVHQSSSIPGHQEPKEGWRRISRRARAWRRGCELDYCYCLFRPLGTRQRTPPRSRRPGARCRIALFPSLPIPRYAAKGTVQRAVTVGQAPVVWAGPAGCRDNGEPPRSGRGRRRPDVSGERPRGGRLDGHAAENAPSAPLFLSPAAGDESNVRARRMRDRKRTQESTRRLPPGAGRPAIPLRSLLIRSCEPATFWPLAVPSALLRCGTHGGSSRPGIFLAVGSCLPPAQGSD